MIGSLLDNAVKFSPPDSAIILRMEKTSRQVKIIVHDPGGEIPAAQQTKIFQRFYRLDDARNRKTGGAGLGLAIAAEIAEHHQGKIDVTSTPDKGTEFIVTLPLLCM